MMDFRLTMIQTQMQVIIYDLEYLHEFFSIPTIQPEDFADNEKAIAAVVIVTEIFHFKAPCFSVIINIARRVCVVIERIEECTPQSPISR